MTRLLVLALLLVAAPALAVEPCAPNAMPVPAGHGTA